MILLMFQYLLEIESNSRQRTARGRTNGFHLICDWISFYSDAFLSTTVIIYLTINGGKKKKGKNTPVNKVL